MAVIIGSARQDENGKAYGGQAGNQSGREISTQNWYLHAKGWRVLRARDAGVGQRLAIAMRAACENKNIGYNQWRRNTLYDAAAVCGFDISRVNTPVETDCSALVRTCIAYAAGITTLPSSLRTGNMCSLILATGQFEELSGKEYTTKSDYLKAGDILCTKTSGHTVIVLTDGARAGEKIRPTLQKGDKGADVANVQKLLMQAGYALPKYGADGDFGDECLSAVKAFQKDNKLTVDGIVGAKTWAALLAISTLEKRYKIIINDVNETVKNKLVEYLANAKITAVVQEG